MSACLALQAAPGAGGGRDAPGMRPLQGAPGQAELHAGNRADHGGPLAPVGSAHGRGAGGAAPRGRASSSWAHAAGTCTEGGRVDEGSTAKGGNRCTEMNEVPQKKPAGNYDLRGAREGPHNEATKWKITKNINPNPQGPVPRHIYPLLVELDPNLARIIKLMVYFFFLKQ